MAMTHAPNSKTMSPAATMHPIKQALVVGLTYLDPHVGQTPTSLGTVPPHLLQVRSVMSFFSGAFTPTLQS